LEDPLVKNAFLKSALISIVSVAVACASSGAGSASRNSPNRISRSEISESSTSNAYELISRLRPNWFRPQATGSVAGGVVRSQGILVYLNRQRLEDLNALKTISTGGIESAEWIDAARVQTVLSDVPSGAIAGAIVIRTR
jgi:hypothetical protein